MPWARPFGLFLIAIFFCVATFILVAVGIALVWPGTTLDAIWQLYPARQAMLMPHRLILGPAFLGLAVAMACASAGCFLRRKWGWQHAILIFGVNGLGDTVRLAMGRFLEGGIGVAAAGAILFYLSRPAVRAAFRAGFIPPN